MPGCHSRETLQDFLDGVLSIGERTALEQHIERCPACRAQTAQLGGGLGTREAGEPSAPLLPQTPEVDTLGLTAGQQVAGYRIVRRLGKGAMGVVYEAVRDDIQRRAAIKLLRPLPAGVPGLELRREARAANLVNHPAMINVHDAGYLDAGVPYLIMDFLEGETLADRLERGAGAAPLLLPLFQQLAEALSAAHDKGIIHRDLKPENVMIVKDPLGPGGERVKILDFGLAQISVRAAPASSPGTHPDLAMGTPVYMAPEQWRSAARVDGKADVYSLGVMLYECLAGRSPFHALTAAELMAMHLQDEAPPLQQLAPQAPAAIAALVHRMLAKTPAERPDMREVASALSAWDRPVAVPGRAPQPDSSLLASQVTQPILPRLTLVLGALVVLGVLGWYLLRPQAPDPSMVRFAGGTFRMGSTPEEAEAAFFYCKGISGAACERELFDREQPVRTVTLSPFWLDPTEVTSEQFAGWLDGLARQGRLRVRADRYVDLHPDGQPLADLYPTYHPSYAIVYRDGRFSAYPGSGRRPATQLTWEAAWRYCADHGKRLPTEAEWEFAARGSEGRRFPWGYDEPRCEGVVYGRASGLECSPQRRGPADVGATSQDRTPEGIFDLGGNVSEWVMDAFHDRHAPCAGTCRDPLIQVDDAAHPGRRAVRGGNWAWTAVFTRATARSRYPKHQGPQIFGFRCAMSAP